jgi:hypothetical protein
MTCPACQAAEQLPRVDSFTSDCLSCKARAMAVTRADLLEDYQTAARTIFGDKIKEGHALVKVWLQRMKQRRTA